MGSFFVNDEIKIDEPSAGIRRVRFKQTEFALIGKAALKHLDDKPDDERRHFEREFLSEWSGLPADHIVSVKQVHGSTALYIEERHLTNSLYAGEADALVACQKNILLNIRTADCVPLFAVALNSEKNVGGISMIHAGWRGLASGMVWNALQKLYEHADQTEEIVVWIAPCIGEESYEVGFDVASVFWESAKEDPTRKGKYFLSLPDVVAKQIQSFTDMFNHRADKNRDKNFLLKVTLQDDLKACTFLENQSFYSHRRGDRGRNLNVMLIR